MLHHHYWMSMPVMNNHLDNQISSLNIHLWSSIGTKPTDGHWLNSITHRKFYFSKLWTVSFSFYSELFPSSEREQCGLFRSILFVRICTWYEITDQRKVLVNVRMVAPQF